MHYLKKNVKRENQELQNDQLGVDPEQNNKMVKGKMEAKNILSFKKSSEGQERRELTQTPAPKRSCPEQPFSFFMEQLKGTQMKITTKSHQKAVTYNRTQKLLCWKAYRTKEQTRSILDSRDVSWQINLRNWISQILSFLSEVRCDRSRYRKMVRVKKRKRIIKRKCKLQNTIKGETKELESFQTSQRRMIMSQCLKQAFHSQIKEERNSIIPAREGVCVNACMQDIYSSNSNKI